MAYYQNPGKIPTLFEALEQLSVDNLKSLLSLLPISEKPKRKAELVNLAYSYLDGNNLRTIWIQLDELQQAAVSEVVHGNSSQFNQEIFKAKYGQLPDFGELNTYYGTKTPTKLRLFFYNYGIIPEDLKKRLKTFVPAPKEISIKEVQELPQTISRTYKYFDYENRKSIRKVEEIPLEVRLMEKTAGQDLLAVLRLVQAGKISVSDKTRHPSKATINQITKVLNGGDFYENNPQDQENYSDDEIGSIRAFSLPLIIQAAGFAQLSGNKLSLTKAGEKALTAPLEKTLQTAWKKWLKTNILDEFRRINNVKGQTGKAQRGFSSVSARREGIASVLEDFSVNSWIEINEFFRYMLATGQDFEVCRYTRHLYICEPGYGYLYDIEGSWSVLEESYTLCFLFEYVATLGIIDVAYIKPNGTRDGFRDLWGTDDYDFLSRYDGLLYFRITPLGAYILGITDSYEAPKFESKSLLKILPNLEIVASEQNFGLADQLFLEQYAKKVSDQVWKLETKSVLEAISKGHQLKELIDFLKALSSNSFPNTVVQFFKDIEQRSNSLTDLGVARLVKCSDAALAALIANDSRTKKYCFLAGEDRLLIPLDLETKFRNGLQKLGYSFPL
jgi:hypothetical protein